MDYATSKGNKKYSFAEYMAIEENSEGKNDFYHGELFAMAGGTKNHNNIVLNVGMSLRTIKKQAGAIIQYPCTKHFYWKIITPHLYSPSITS